MKKILMALCMFSPFVGCLADSSGTWPGFLHGMGIGGWLTNYKRFNVLPEKWRLPITIGDLEHFDTYITEKDVAYIKKSGFDHIRLGFDQIVLEESPYKYRERTFQKLDDFITWCEKYKLNIVLNLHKAVGNYCDIQEKTSLMDDPELQKRYIALWLELERRYHAKRQIAFELLNEVRNVEPEKWNKLASLTLSAIRKQNPDRWVVIGSTFWNSSAYLEKLKIQDDAKVVYTFHMYDPQPFTHQRGVLMAPQLYYNRVMYYPSNDIVRYRDFDRLLGKNTFANVTAVNRDYLKSCMKGAFEFRKKYPKKILWLGEFGTIRHAPQKCRIAYMRDVISLCKEAGIPRGVYGTIFQPQMMETAFLWWMMIQGNFFPQIF